MNIYKEHKLRNIVSDADKLEAIADGPSFFVLLLIPFTYSILQGVGFGYILFVCIGGLGGAT